MYAGVTIRTTTITTIMILMNEAFQDLYSLGHPGPRSIEHLFGMALLASQIRLKL